MAQDTQSIDDLSALRDEPFVEAIAKIEQLMSHPNRVFLLGAGCSKCAGLPLMTELTESVANDKDLKDNTKTILSFLRTEYEGGHGSTVEDYLSDIADISAVAARRSNCGIQNSRIDLGGHPYSTQELDEATQDIKGVMVRHLQPSNLNVDSHRSFVHAVESLRTGKAGRSGQVDYFVLNYDTLIEDALGLEGLPYVDGFCGGGVAWWDRDIFLERSCGARVFKLHGSIDWHLLAGDARPRRIRDERLLESLTSVKERAMIWPAATKYQEAQRDPFAQLLTCLRKSLNPGGTQEVVLTICGYRFADMHINAEIEQAIRVSDKRLTVLLFTEDEEAPAFVKRWMNTDIADQVRIHARRGFFHGLLKHQSQIDLPWWRFESLVRLLGGER